MRYRHALEDADVEDAFHMNLLDYWQSNHLKNDVEREGEEIRKAIDELTTPVKLVAGHVKDLPVIADPTGLSFSVSTLGNLRHVMAGEELEKLEPLFGDHDILREVLGIDQRVAFRIWNFFRGHAGGKALPEIEGMTPEILSALRKHFFVRE